MHRNEQETDRNRLHTYKNMEFYEITPKEINKIKLVISQIFQVVWKFNSMKQGNDWGVRARCPLMSGVQPPFFGLFISMETWDESGHCHQVPGGDLLERSGLNSPTTHCGKWGRWSVEEKKNFWGPSAGSTVLFEYLQRCLSYQKQPT